MTQNQIAYQSLVENQRHNLQMEDLERDRINIQKWKPVTDITGILAKTFSRGGGR